MASDPRAILDHTLPPEQDLERDLHTEHQILNMGPSHPATHGTVKFLIELDGETIVDLDIQVGYLHRGFEKECESGTWYQAIPYTDRLNYNSAILANVGYCMAVEKLLGIETPERCQWLRVLAAELSRIGDHLTRCLSRLAGVLQHPLDVAGARSIGTVGHMAEDAFLPHVIVPSAVGAEVDELAGGWWAFGH